MTRIQDKSSEVAVVARPATPANEAPARALTSSDHLASFKATLIADYTDFARSGQDLRAAYRSMNAADRLEARGAITALVSRRSIELLGVAQGEIASNGRFTPEAGFALQMEASIRSMADRIIASVTPVADELLRQRRDAA